MHLYWITEHINYKGNELADLAANGVVQEAVILPTGPVRNYKQAKGRIKSTTRNKWQWAWDISPIYEVRLAVDVMVVSL